MGSEGHGGKIEPSSGNFSLIEPREYKRVIYEQNQNLGVMEATQENNVFFRARRKGGGRKRAIYQQWQTISAIFLFPLFSHLNLNLPFPPPSPLFPGGSPQLIFSVSFSTLCSMTPISEGISTHTKREANHPYRHTHPYFFAISFLSDRTLLVHFGGKAKSAESKGIFSLLAASRP